MFEKETRNQCITTQIINPTEVLVFFCPKTLIILPITKYHGGNQIQDL